MADTYTFTTNDIGRFDATVLNNGNIFIAYQDVTDSYKGKFVILGVNGTVVKAITTFDSDYAGEISCSLLSTGNVVIAYLDATTGVAEFVIYDASGTLVNSAVTFGDSTIRNTAVVGLNNGNIFIGYERLSEGGYGRFVIYNTNGEVVKAETTYDASDIRGECYATLLDNTNVFLIYRDSAGKGSFVIYDEDGVSVKAKTTFNDANTFLHSSPAVLDNTNVFIAYRNASWDGEFVIYDEDGNLLSLSTLTIDSAPTPAAFSVAATLTGQSSGVTCTVSAVISNTEYIVADVSGTFTDGEIISDGTNSIDCATGYPVVATTSPYTFRTDNYTYSISPAKVTGGNVFLAYKDSSSWDGLYQIFTQWGVLDTVETTFDSGSVSTIKVLSSGVYVDIIYEVDSNGKSYVDVLGPPSKPINPTPSDAEKKVATDTANITWEDGGGAASYNVYFGTESGNLTLQATGITDVSYAMPVTGNLLYSTLYYWRIDAVNDVGTTTGDEWSFYTPVSYLAYSRFSDYDETKTFDQATEAWGTDFDAVGGGRYGEQLVVIGHNSIYFGSL